MVNKTVLNHSKNSDGFQSWRCSRDTSLLVRNQFLSIALLEQSGHCIEIFES